MAASLPASGVVPTVHAPASPSSDVDASGSRTWYVSAPSLSAAAMKASA